MSLEDGSLNSISSQSLESLKEAYKQKLDDILNKQLTVENIEIFADEALSETIQLTDEILAQYRDNSEFHGDTTLNTQKQEDEAFKLLGLPNLQEVLQSIIDVRDKIAVLKEYINTNTENIDEVITPPQPDWQTEINGGSGKGIEKKTFPRLLTLLYILEHDFDIAPSEVLITEGVVTPNMMRQTPYVRVEISDLERVIYICDEEGNASYIFDTTKLGERGLTLEEIDVDDKGDKNSLIAHYPGIGIRLVQSENWRVRVADALGEPIPEIQTDINEQEEREERKNISEFRRERGTWPSFEDFQSEVREFFPGSGDVQKWYKEERKKHPNWCSHPYITYKDGWLGWPELVGIENRTKKEYPPFGDFQNEVRGVYLGEVDIGGWYSKERKQHKNWPSQPSKIYKDDGWEGFSELVGKENPLKKEFSSFEDFQNEVMSLYPMTGNVHSWYNNERKNHKNWPANPSKIYKDKGWVGWSELVDVENRFKIERLSFEDFQNEVRNIYSGETNVKNWYDNEKKKHPKWPSNPYSMYKDKGFIGLPEIVGIENKFKKENPSFEDFRSEVIDSYNGEGDINSWYQEEKKKHPKWPSNPWAIYKDDGWEGFPELIGKENRLKKEWPSFEDFRDEVRSFYKGESNIQLWYLSEQPKHLNWPTGPHGIYKDKGWTNWPELVGNEKVEHLSFENFQSEVRSVYKGEKNVQNWYKEIADKHPNWPSDPNKKYEDGGWAGWPELVGKISRLRKEYPPFEIFQNEVRSLYPEGRPISGWYREEQKKHKNWPPVPERTYKDKGWVGLSELVGKKG